MECDLCKSKNLKTCFPYHTYSLVECRNCKLRFLDPLPSPDELKKLYSSDYYFSPDSNLYGYSNYKEDVNLIVLTAIQRYNTLRLILGKSSHLKLLDTGCAYGYYIDIARLYGWDVSGVEINEECVKEAKNKLNLDVRKGTLEEQHFPAETFDVVTCWDMIEHLLNPSNFLQQVNRILKPGGYFLLTTPDVGSIPAKVLGKRWMGYKSYEHVYFFNKKTIKLYLEANGFALTRFQYTGKYISKQLFLDRLKYYSKFLGWLVSFLNNLPLNVFYLNPLDIMLVIARKEKLVP
ncbi:MAG: class I SAM-dependent methyltransferase [Candidatus Melainabacteria bacterium]|nr:class I SAM-dependent methyltransferase [Candidatus Melainabacteria bacterium]